MSSPAQRRGGAAAKDERPPDPEKTRIGHLIDGIVGGVNANTSKGKAEVEAWKGAQRATFELRDKLLERGWPPAASQSQREAEQAPQRFTRRSPHSDETAARAAVLFPGDWWRALSAEPLAALVVDTFASAFCDALIDGLVMTLEEREGWALPPSTTPLGHSASAPLLATGRPRRIAGALELPRLRDPAGQPGLAGLPRGGLDPRGDWGVGSPTGLVLSGLPPADSLETWTRCQFHACPRVETYSRRVQQAAELQRPRRRPMAPAAGAEELRDERKYVWPMARSHFPEEWDEVTAKRRQSSSMGERQSHMERRDTAAASRNEGAGFIIGTDHEGKTKFPYSLALHKAFLESQASTKLQSKAMQIAPLRITTSDFY